MATILEMATNIVTNHAASTTMSKEELLNEMQEVYNTLARLEKEESEGGVPAEEEAPAVNKKQAFRKHKVVCMLCGKEMKTLGRHLRSTHGMTPAEYRQKFDIPRSQPLAAKAYSETRRQMALDKGLGDNLAKAREARKKKK